MLSLAKVLHPPRGTLQSPTKHLRSLGKLCSHSEVVRKSILSPKKNFAFFCKNIVLTQETLLSPTKHLHSLAKVLRSPEKTFAFAKKVLHSFKKCCILSQNICIHLQMYCIPSLKFPLTCKTFAFSLNMCISLCNKLYINNTLASILKGFFEVKVSWGNAIL